MRSSRGLVTENAAVGAAMLVGRRDRSLAPRAFGRMGTPDAAPVPAGYDLRGCFLHQAYRRRGGLPTGRAGTGRAGPNPCASLSRSFRQT